MHKAADHPHAGTHLTGSLSDDAVVRSVEPFSAPTGFASVPRGRVALHVLALCMCWSTVQATDLLMPVIAKRAFAATDWQVVLMTAAPMVLMVLSIFWNDRLRRMTLGRYMAVYALVAMAPMLAVPLSRDYWHLAAVYLATCLGKAAWPVVNGEIIKHIYPDAVRGRVYGGVTTASLVVSGAMSYGLGRWLHHDQGAWAVFLPVLVLVQVAGVWLYWSIAHRAGAESHRVLADPHEGHPLRRVVEPLAHTREVLREDRVFARYEAAFMTYGMGWMVFYALVPLVGVNKLSLSYEQMGAFAFMPFQISRAVCTFAGGWMMDRYGATRTCAAAFALYTAAPIVLALSTGPSMMTAACVVWGVASAGVDAGWMLGPVSLAPSKAKVPQYVAIHATMVGVRGSLFQFMGVWLYILTGSFMWPLALAAGSFVWAAWQMLRLRAVMLAQGRAG